jgi:hypothetical protein
MPTKKTPVYSLYWSNLDKDIVDLQKKVFDHLGIPLVQELRDKMPHGIWMDDVIKRASDSDIVIIADIDAFPLNYAAYEKAITSAANNEIFGLAQAANHLQRDKIYAAPMFMAFKKKLWADLGNPSLTDSLNLDAGQSLSECAQKQGIPLRLCFPTACIKPKWPLHNRGVYGIGSFYENDFFHLFEARDRFGRDFSKDIFKAVADDLLNDRDLDFAKYLQYAKRKPLREFLRRKLNKFRKLWSERH